MAQRRLEVLITGNAKDAQKAFGDLEKSAAKSGKKTESSLSKMQKGLVGLGLAGAAIGSFKAFEESEKVARQTEAVIKSTGGEAQVTADHIGDLASEMSKLGGVDDELVQQGANMLLTFTKVRNEVGKGNDIFDQATLAANNYAAATGTDVVAANKLLGTVLNDPLKGLTKLTKAGVQFTQQQKDQIAAMVASGDTMGAQKVILAEFSKQFGGSLEANATASGKAQVALENMGESIGQILAPAMTRGADSLASLASGFSSLPESAQTAILAVGGISAAAIIAGPRVVEFAGMVKDGADALSGMVSPAGSAAGAVNGSLSAIGGLPGAAAGAAVGIGVLAVAYTSLTEDGRKATKGALELIEAAKATGDTLEETFDDRLAKTIAGVTGGFDLAGSGKDLGSNLEQMGISAKEFAEALHGTDQEYKAFRDSLGEKFQDDPNRLGAFETLKTDMSVLREASIQADERSAEYARTQKDLGVVQKDLGVQTDATASSTDGLTTSTGEAKTAGDGWLGSNRDLIDAFQERIRKQKEINDGMQEAIDLAYASVDSNLALRSAHDSVQDATIALDEARKNGSSPETIQRSQDDLTAAILRESVATREAAAANAEAAGKSFTAGEAALIQRNKLAELQAQTGFTSAELRGLVAKLDNASSERQVKLNTAQAEANISSLQQKTQAYIDTLSLGATLAANSGLYGETGAISGSIGSSGGAQNSKAGHDRPGRRPGRAAGGPVEAGMIYEVNERGQELFAAGMSGTIINASKTKQMLGNTSVNGGTRGYGGGGSVTNIWNITETTSARATANEVARILNRETRMGRNPLVGANG